MSLFSKVKTPQFGAAFLAASLAFAPAAAAQPEPAEPVDPEAVQEDEQVTDYQIGSHILVIGAAKDPASAGIPAPPEDETVPALPVVYDDEADAKVSLPAGAAPPASPAR
jgi:hypothetical protein